MKTRFALLFVLLVSACAPATQSASNTTLRSEGTKVSYDSFLMPEAPEILALVNFNRVTVTAPTGTELDYEVDRGSVSVKGVGTNSMTVDLVTGPAQVEILVRKCADVCPTLVHFLHEVVYSQ